MTDQNQEVQNNEGGSNSRITLPTDHMVRTKSASGGISFHCGDQVAKALDGMKLKHVEVLATEAFGIEVAKYEHLNAGQIRMTLGNVMRNMLRRQPELSEKFNEVYAQVKELAEQDAAAEQAASDAEKAAKAADKAEKEAKAAAEKQAAATQKEADRAAADAKKAADKAEKDAARAAEKARKEAEREADKLARQQARAAEKAKKDADKAAAKASKKAEEAEEPTGDAE